jgi:hypothetical protein
MMNVQKQHFLFFQRKISLKMENQAETCWKLL